MNDLTSWLQASAAFIALWLAYNANKRADEAYLRADRERREDAVLRARCIATAIYPDLLEIEVLHSRAKQFVAGRVVAFAEMARQTLEFDVCKVVGIDVPSMLSRQMPVLHHLGAEAGPTVLQLVAVILQYAGRLKEIETRLSVVAPEDWPETFGHLSGHLTAIEMLVGNAIKEVGRLHDAEKFTLPL